MDWIEGNDRCNRTEALRKWRLLINGGVFMKKRLLSVVLAFTLCFGMMPATALAQGMGNAEMVVPAPGDKVSVMAVDSTQERDTVGDTVSGNSANFGGVNVNPLMNNDGIAVMADDTTETVVATLDGVDYTDMTTALEAWQAKGGMLALQGESAKYNISTVTWSFPNAAGVLDLSGQRIIGNITLSGSSKYPLEIRDSKEKVSSNGALQGLTVEKGAKLTLTDGGYISQVTVADGAEDGIKLMGGKVAGLKCSAPVYHMIPEGYALMNGNITEDPTKVIEYSEGLTLTAKDAQITVTGDRAGSVAYGEHKIPFAISVTTNDSEIGLMGFEWYLVKEDGTTALLMEHRRDVWSDGNGAYHYDVTMDGSNNIGWESLEANKAYDIICVSIGKEKDGAYQWQTPLKGFQLTITPASLNSENTTVEITNAEELEYTGNPLAAEVKVTYRGTELTKGQDYKVSSNTGTEAGIYTLNITGQGNYEGSVDKTFTIRPTDKLTVEGTADAGAVYGTKISDIVINGLTVRLNGIVVPGAWKFSGRQISNAGTTAAYTAVFTPESKNYKQIKQRITPNIRKAAARTLTDIPVSIKYNVTMGEASIQNAGMPVDAGTLAFTKGGTAGRTGSVTVMDWEIDRDTGKVTYILAGGAVGDTVTLPVTIASTNYETSTVNVKITLTNKEEQTALTVTGKTTVEFGHTLQLGTKGGSGTGNVTYTVTNGDGQAGIDADGKLIPTKVGTVTVTATKAGDDNYNAITSAPMTVTITRAASTGTPGYTGITTDGKTLRDTDLRISGGSLHPTAGRLEWIDDAGNVLPDTTVVEANKTYLWRYTPEDTNYVPLTGSVVLYPVSNRGDISDVPDTPSYTPTPAVPDTGDSSSDDDDDDDTPAVSNSSNSTTARQPSAGPAALDYAIKRGDTLGAIARKYGCTVAELVAANSDLIKNPNRIHIGWKLKIPQHRTTGMMVAPTDNNNSDAYIIKPGDSLWAIARRYGCTVADIVKMNSNLITMPDRIRVGWQLNMPVK